MRPFLYSFFHEKTNDRGEGGLVAIPKDSNLWPESWKKPEYKRYSRSPKITLPDTAVESGLSSLLLERTSAIAQVGAERMSLEDVSHLIQSAYGIIEREGVNHRTVPSGGSRYPLELYVSVWGEVDGLERGQYHFDVLGRALSTLPSDALTPADISSFTNYEWVHQAKGVILLSAVMNRSVQKYGSRGYRYILLEAGHAGQNICLAAAERKRAVRPIGGITETYFEDKLQLDVTAERIVYAIVF
jgi:SagB-type dehydrogenase family enzyme